MKYLRFLTKAFELKTPLLLIGLALAALSLSACSSNIFSKAADKTSDAALLEEANQLINEEEYVLALEKLELVSVKGKTGRDFKITYAAALAGRCGLNFINFFTRVSDSTTVGGLFSFMMAGFTGTVVSATECTTAMAQMRSLAGADTIGDTGDDQIFMTILGFATMGAVLAEKADINGAGGAGDGTIDAGFDICSSSTADHVSDENIAHLVAALGTVILNIGGLAGGASVVTAVQDFTNSCDALKANPGDPNPCVLTDPDNVGANEILIIRKLLDVEGFKNPSTCDDTSASSIALTCCP